MKLLRFGPPGGERPGVQLADAVRLDASEGVEDYDEAFFAHDGPAVLQQWLDREGARAPRIARHTRLGPVVGRPSKIVCVGLNFRDHAAESGMDRPSRSFSLKPLHRWPGRTMTS